MSKLYLGLDVGGTKMLLLSVRGVQSSGVGQVPTGAGATPEYIERELYKLIEALPEKPSSIGIAIPGLIDPEERVLACDVLPNLEGWRPKRLSERFRCPVHIINDAEAALVGETYHLSGGTTAAVVMVGTGIGAAFFINQAICKGSRGWAGELGSIPISTLSGVRTLDSLAAGRPLLNRIDLDPAIALGKIATNQADAIAEVAAAGNALGIGLATVINLLNPALIVVEGGTLSLPGYLDAALAGAQSFSLPELWKACTIRRSTFGSSLVAFGAAKFSEVSLIRS